MVANSMRNLFKELYDGASAQEMGFDDIEVMRFLNLSQDLIIKENFYPLRNRFKEGFETSSKRDMELNNLKRSATTWFNKLTNYWETINYNGVLESNTEIISNDLITNNNSVMIELLEEVLLLLGSDTVDIKLKTELQDKNTIRNIHVKNINEDNLDNILKNPFEKPDITVIYRSLEKRTEDDDHKFVKFYLPEGYEFMRWNFSYLKRPREIVVDILDPSQQINCELDEIIHNDIVFKAVELALGSIGSQKTQIAIHNTNTKTN